MYVSNQTEKMRNALTQGVRKGLSSYIWLLKILVPISLATALLENSGWLHRLDFLLEPAMAVMSLPPAAALPILIGLTAGIYGCLAAIAVLPLSVEHITLITIFVLIAHNLPQEGAIQAKSGINFVKTTLVRLVAAVLTCLIAAWWLQPEPVDMVAVSEDLRELSSVWPFLQDWLGGMLSVCAKILVIVIGVMTLIELMKEFNLVEMFVRLFAPVLRIMGLHQRAGVLWLTGVLFGLAYGGAVIVEESRNLRLSPEEVEKLQLSIGINHSMIEDPLLFLPLGVNPFWLWVPRLVVAVATVHLIAIWFKFRRMFERKTATRD
jgi:Fe2+ transport system protein B